MQNTTPSDASTVISWLPPDLRRLDATPADLLVLHAFEDERPLRGLAGLVDWRLAGRLSAWRMGGFSEGTFGEEILYPSAARLSQQRLLFIGLGPEAAYRSDRALYLAEKVRETARLLHARSLVLGLFHLDQLASPVERMGPKLLSLFRDQPDLDRVTFVATDSSRKLIEDSIQFFGR